MTGPDPVQERDGRIELQAWMAWPSTRRVIAALEAAGGAPRFVGGCVRNAIMGRPVTDIDIATPLRPEAVIEALKAAGLKAVPTGIEHGTVTAVTDRTPFEITTLRRDVETDGRRAVVAFTDDWREDAQRRDFRLNAVYADGEGRLYDPTGAGVDDAKAGRIVFVGDAEARIREDYLRILRFFRFYAWYGAGELDGEGLRTSAALKAGLKTLSAERVSKELLKLLAADDPVPAARLMADAGVLAEVAPEASDLDRLEAVARSGLEAAGDPLLRLAAMLPAEPATARELARRLRLSNAQRDRLVAAAEPTEFPMSDHDARLIVYRGGRQAAADRLALAWAATPSADRGRLEQLLALVEGPAPVPPPISGADVLAAGVPGGRKVGEVQRAMEAWWIERDFAATRDEVRQALAREAARVMRTDPA
jgi:poly(A) polymerase